MISAFGVDHGDISKHYVGHHGEEFPHSRSQHSELRYGKRAAKRSYVTARDNVYYKEAEKHQKQHPGMHAFDSVAGIGLTSHVSQSDIHASRKTRQWMKSPKGMAAKQVADRAKGKWNPRFEAKRQVQIKVNRQMGRAS